MRYIEVSLDTPAHLIDERCEALASLGAEGFVIENEEDFNNFLENNRQYWDYVDEQLTQSYQGVSRIKLYLTDDPQGEAVLDRILSAFPQAVHGYTADQDWENGWKDYYEPIETGEKLVVVPAWLDRPDDGRIPLRLEPGIAFGTGSHPTTKLCLNRLENYVTHETRVLDLGCGSGILGIGALLLGAQCCIGCDIDPLAAEAVKSNAALNAIPPEQFSVFTGDLLTDLPLRGKLGTGYQLVLANIVSDVILSLAPTVREFMADGGIFICSGIIEGRWEEVQKGLLSCGLRILSHTRDEEWHCFVCC